jgi:hypothetical protein
MIRSTVSAIRAPVVSPRRRAVSGGVLLRKLYIVFQIVVDCEKAAVTGSRSEQIAYPPVVLFAAIFVLSAPPSNTAVIAVDEAVPFSIREVAEKGEVGEGVLFRYH